MTPRWSVFTWEPWEPKKANKNVSKKIPRYRSSGVFQFDNLTNYFKGVICLVLIDEDVSLCWVSYIVKGNFT